MNKNYLKKTTTSTVHTAHGSVNGRNSINRGGIAWSFSMMAGNFMCVFFCIVHWPWHFVIIFTGNFLLKIFNLSRLWKLDGNFVKLQNGHSSQMEVKWCVLMSTRSGNNWNVHTIHKTFTNRITTSKKSHKQ